MEQKFADMFSRVQKTACYAADVAAKKGKEVLETSKSSVKILELKSQIDALYKEIGKLVYEAQNGVNVDSQIIEDKILEITNKFDEINQLSEKKDSIKNTVVCGNCQTIGRKDEVYCANCGAKY